MKFLILTSPDQTHTRLKPLFNTLKSLYNYEIVFKDASLISDSMVQYFDIILYDYFNLRSKTLFTSLTTIDGSGGEEESMVKHANDNKDIFLNFKGKLYFMSLDDICASYIIGLDEEIFDRIDGWFTLLKRVDAENKFYSKHYDSKYCILPRFVNHIDIPVTDYDLKENKIHFYGSTSGTLQFYGKNQRVEALKLIKSNPYLDSNFNGGVIRNIIVDMHTQDVEYNKTIPYANQPIITYDEICSNISNYKLSLCLPGNSLLGDRNYITLAARSTMICPNLIYDPVEWFFSDKLKDCFFEIKNDLSDLVSVCMYALQNSNEAKKIAQHGWSVYEKYFQLNNDCTYNHYMWLNVKTNLQSINFPV